MEPQTTFPLVCKYCKVSVAEEDFFCRNCGKKLKDKPVSVSFFALLWLLILSTLLPPLGIGLTIRYIRSIDNKRKIVGWISLAVTLIALYFAVKFSLSALETFNQQVNSQLQNYQF